MLYNVVLVSAMCQHEPAIYMCRLPSEPLPPPPTPTFLSFFSLLSSPGFFLWLYLSLSKLKFGSLSDDRLSREIVVRILRCWSEVYFYKRFHLFIVAKCWGLFSLIGWIIQVYPFLGYPKIKESKYILQMHFPFMQWHLIIAGSLHFTYLGGLEVLAVK